MKMIKPTMRDVRVACAAAGVELPKATRWPQHYNDKRVHGGRIKFNTISGFISRSQEHKIESLLTNMFPEHHFQLRNWKGKSSTIHFQEH